MKKIAIILLLFLLYFVTDASAAKRYWIATGSSGWNSTSNWSTTSTGSGGSSVPGTNDTAYFTSSKNGSCTIDATVNVKRLEMQSGYTGTVSQGTYSITIGTSGATLSGGTFTGGSATLVSNGTFVISGTAFTSTTGLLSCVANFTFSSGSFTHNSGKVKFSATCTITGSVTFKQLEFAPSGNSTFTIASGTTLTVDSTLTVSGSSGSSINTGSIDAKGDVIISNSSNNIGGGTATITIKGTGNQAFTGSTTTGAGRTCNIVINKSSGTVTLSNYITVMGNWTYTSGTIDAGSSTVYFFGTKTITGTHSLYNVIFHGSGNATFTVSTGTTLTATGKITIANGSNAATINTGTIEAQGDLTVTNTSTSSGGSGEIKFTGSAVQTFTGSGTAGQGKTPKITINKSGGYLNLSSVISVSGNWTYVAGTVKRNDSSVALYGAGNLDALEDGTSNLMSFYNLAIASGTITLTSNIDVDNNLTISSGSTLSASSNTIYVGGQWNSQGTWTYSSSTVVFDGNGYRQITGVTGSAVNFYNVTFNKTAESLTLSRPVKVYNTLTLTKGHIITSPTNYLEVAHGATCTGGGVGAYVHGPMRKTGNAAFSFPLGDTTLTDSAAYHPLAITAPSTSTDQFEARYYATGQTVGDSLVDSLASVSGEEYWTLERKAGTANVYVTVGWNRNSDINNIGSLRLAGWNGTKWLDYGQADLSINWPTGIVGSSIAISFPSNPIYISIGTSRPTYYGHARLKRKLDGGYYETKGKSLYFSFEDEYNDQNHHLTYKVYDEANSNVAPTLVYNSNNDPLSYYGDNRFKLDLYTSSGALHNGYYILEVTNEKDEKFYLRFHIN